MVILFEGRDAAGKGGTIKRFHEHLNPRGARGWRCKSPLKPSVAGNFQRYVQHHPHQGEIVMFDRSWCNRAGVERVMSFAQTPNTPSSCARPLSLSATWCAVACMIKFWFSVSQRAAPPLQEREAHLLKQWTQPHRHRIAGQMGRLHAPKEAMFCDTGTADAPWTVIKSDCKKRARLNAMRYVLHKLPYAAKDLAQYRQAGPTHRGARPCGVRAWRAARARSSNQTANQARPPGGDAL